MTPEQFCYWLQGRAELVPTPPSEAEWTAIRDHLGAVFKKVTPDRYALQQLHDRAAEQQAAAFRAPNYGAAIQC